MLKVLVLLLTMPTGHDFDIVIGDGKYTGEVRQKLETRLTEITTELRKVTTKDLEAAVKVIGELAKGDQKTVGHTVGRRRLMEAVPRKPKESVADYEVRLKECIGTMYGNIKLICRLAFDCDVWELPTAKFVSIWADKSARVEGTRELVNRQYPIMMCEGRYGFDPEYRPGWGGTSAAYMPLAEFDYYVKKFPRRALLIGK